MASVFLLSVDPGLQGSGCALWTLTQDGWDLASAWFLKSTSARGPGAWVSTAVGLRERLGLDPDIVAVERMRMYTQGRARPDDILELQSIGAAILGHFPYASHYALLPQRWKGQVPREVMGNRVEKKVKERGWDGRVEVPSRKTWLNDVMHGVGLGMFVIDREVVQSRGRWVV